MPFRLPEAEADAPPAHSPATGFAAYAVSPETARRAPHLHPAALPPPRAPYPGYGTGYSPSHGTSHGAGEISLADLMATLATGKWTILVCTLLAMLAGSLWVLGTPPAYRAEALLQLEKRAGGLALPGTMQELLDGRTAAAGDAEIAILRSRPVLRRAALETGLDLVAEPLRLPLLGNLPARLGLADPHIAALTPYAWGNERIRLGALDLPPDMLGQPLRLTITGPGTYRLTLPETAAADHPPQLPATAAAPLPIAAPPKNLSLAGAVGTRLETAGLSLLIEDLHGPLGRSFTLQRLDPDTATERALAAFTAVETPRNSALLRLTYTAPTPERAEATLAAIIRAYLDQNIQRSAAEAQSSLEFIEQQLPLAEAEMTRAQEALNLYRHAQNSVDVNYETQKLLEQATAIETELNALALREDDIKKRYTPNHPTYQSLLETRAALQTRLDHVRSQTADLPQTQREIFNLTRALEVAQQVYLQLLNRAQELRVLRAATVGSVRIVDPAWSHRRNVNTGALRGLLFSMLTGLSLGLVILLTRPLLSRSIRSPEDIERAGLTVLATIAHSPAAKRNSRRARPALLALTHPQDSAVEALRALRTALQVSLQRSKSRSLLVTSALPDAGKSFTALNLAIIAAQAGQKVCLIDADLRRGYLHRALPQALPRARPTRAAASVTTGAAAKAPARGLAEFLAAQAAETDILQDGPIPGLTLITAGKYPQNPAELLMQPEMGALLASLESRFDLVILDSPPILAVTDAALIARNTGAVLIVLRQLQTQPAQIDAAAKSLEIAGISPTGAVLNDFRPKRAGIQAASAAYGYRYSYRSRA